MSRDPKKQSLDQRFEAKIRRVMASLRSDPDWEKVHYTIDGKDNPRVQAFNEAMKAERRRKVN